MVTRRVIYFPWYRVVGALEDQLAANRLVDVIWDIYVYVGSSGNSTHISTGTENNTTRDPIYSPSTLTEPGSMPGKACRDHCL